MRKYEKTEYRSDNESDTTENKQGRYLKTKPRIDHTFRNDPDYMRHIRRLRGADPDLMTADVSDNESSGNEYFPVANSDGDVIYWQKYKKPLRTNYHWKTPDNLVKVAEAIENIK